MIIDSISIGKNPPDDVNVIIEVPIGGDPIKYEMDKESGALVVDRFLYTAMHYPGNYGFIPHTLSGDGDPCDVLVANTRAIAPGAVISVRPVGVLVMEDNAGEDEKIIAVPSRHLTMRYDRIENYTTCRTSRSSRSSTSSSITRIWNPASGSRSSAGATRPRPSASSTRVSSAPRPRRLNHGPLRAVQEVFVQALPHPEAPRSGLEGALQWSSRDPWKAPSRPFAQAKGASG